MMNTLIVMVRTKPGHHEMAQAQRVNTKQKHIMMIIGSDLWIYLKGKLHRHPPVPMVKVLMI
jgi:hypothetical protein